MHILSQETDNCSSWISGRERMTVENISWSISTKECCRPSRGQIHNLLIISRARIQLSHPARLCRGLVKAEYLMVILGYFSQFLHKNIFRWYSIKCLAEADSNKYSESTCMFLWRNNKIMNKKLNKLSATFSAIIINLNKLSAIFFYMWKTLTFRDSHLPKVFWQTSL